MLIKMSRYAKLECACGWSMYISDTQIHDSVLCKNCGEVYYFEDI